MIDGHLLVWTEYTVIGDHLRNFELDKILNILIHLIVGVLTGPNDITLIIKYLTCCFFEFIENKKLRAIIDFILYLNSWFHQ